MSFIKIVPKRLTAVEADPKRSNQHEFNGVSPLRDLLGLDRIEFPISFSYVTKEIATITANSSCTWYDARDKKPRAPEHRLYFPSNAVMEAANEGDLIIFGVNPDRTLSAIVAKAGSQAEAQLLRDFGISL